MESDHSPSESPVGRKKAEGAGSGSSDRTIQAFGAVSGPLPVPTPPPGGTPGDSRDSGVPPGTPSGEVAKAGRYVVRKEIGRGGMGRVLLVHDDHLDREVALKELVSAPGKTEGGTLLARFLREARLSGRLGHPSIIPVHDLGQHPDGRVFYTMRFVDGKGFDAALRGCKNLQQRLHFLPNFRDVCNALAFAHSHNIIHRDLKPGNIILGAFGETVVVDWGLAKVLGDGSLGDADDTPGAGETADAGPASTGTATTGSSSPGSSTGPSTGPGSTGLSGSGASRDSFTRVGSILGTPAYMSPEQTMGQHDVIDARSDQYSLGAILYEILAGRPPHQADSVKAMLLKVVSEPVTPVVELEPPCATKFETRGSVLLLEGRDRSPRA